MASTLLKQAIRSAVVRCRLPILRGYTTDAAKCPTTVKEVKDTGFHWIAGHCGNCKSLSLNISPYSLRRYHHCESSHCESGYVDEKNVSSIFHDSICNAMSHGIRELDINFMVYNSDVNNFKLELPQSLLKVDSCRTTYPPAKPGSLPGLKFVDIKLREGSDYSSIGEFLSNCSVLENLRIDVTIDGEDDNLNLSAPQLKTLSTKCSGSDETTAGYVSFHVPKLENLEVSADDFYHLAKYIFKDAKSLVRAKIHIDTRYWDFVLDEEHDEEHDEEERRIGVFVERAASLLAEVSAARYLEISAPNLRGYCSLPDFARLKQLKLELFHCTYWEWLMEFLMRSPSLEDLVLDINARTWGDEVDFEPFKPPEMVPSCVLTRLQTISITNFMGFDDEFDVLKYFLENGEVLNKITICTSNVHLCRTRRMTQEKLKQKLCKYQKYSKTCEIEIKLPHEDVHFDRCGDCDSRRLHYSTCSW